MLRKFQIRTRLLISFFIVVSFALIVGVTGYASLTSLGNLAVKTINNVNILNDIYDYNVAIDSGIFNMIYVSDAALNDYVLQTTKECKEGMLERLDKYLENQEQFSDVFTPGEMQDIVNLLEIYRGSYIPVLDEIFDFVEQGRDEEALSVYVNRFSPIYNVFTYYINMGFAKNLEYSLTETSRNSESASVNAFLMLAVVLLSLVVSVLLALAVTKSIAVPLSALGAAADKAAHEELDVQFDKSQSNDEIDRLSLRLSEMLQHLKQGQKSKLEAVEAKHEREKAEAASKAKSEFLAGMSHEIRTPMNAITGMAELLLRRNLPDEAREEVLDIKQAGNSLITIINDILDFSKIEAGKLEITPAEYGLASLINDTANIIRMRLEEKPVKFLVDIDSNTPNNLIGDEVRLRQIMTNLLSNSAKYTEEGHIGLTVSAWKQDCGHIRLAITVSDTGKGIKPEDQVKLFDDFVRLDIKKNRNIEGTGLGLAITKRLCEAMGGTISVESDYGKGSCFRAEIIQGLTDDAVIGEETAENLRNFRYVSRREQKAIEYLRLDGVKVLVADDNTANLRVACGLLAPYGLEADTAASGQEAVEKVKRKNYDMIFMDHMMPDMDGIEATEAIRAWEAEAMNNEKLTMNNEREGARCSAVPIIALTANAISGMRDFYLENGFDDYLTKPVNPHLLDEILKKWLPESLLSPAQAGVPIPIREIPAADNAAPESLSRMKSEFLDTMSHKIKTPLTVISSHVKKAKRLFETGDSGQTFAEGETIRRSLTRAQEEIMRTGQMIDNALRQAADIKEGVNA